MADQLTRALAADGSIRVVGVITTDSTQEARDRHQLSNVATVALGRTIAAGFLLVSAMKRPQSRINLRIRSSGPLGGLLVDAGLDGTVRGYVTHPAAELPLKEDGRPNVSQALGSGYLYLLRDVGYGRPHNSTVELITSEVSDDIAYFLSNSEQTASAIELDVVMGEDGVERAGGILIQVLPKAHRDEVLSKLVYSQAGNLKTFPKLLAEGHSMAEIMEMLLGDLGIEIMPETQPLRFFCPCTRDRLLGAMRMFGTDELQDMIEKDQGAEATCDICGEVYNLSSEELSDLIKTMDEEAIAARS
jgi:molecular chaperone Hsp33